MSKQSHIKDKYVKSYANFLVNSQKKNNAFASFNDNERYLTDDMYAVMRECEYVLKPDNGPDALDSNSTRQPYGTGYSVLFALSRDQIQPFQHILMQSASYLPDTIQNANISCSMNLIENKCTVIFHADSADIDLTDKLDCMILRALCTYKFEQTFGYKYGSCSAQRWMPFWYNCLSRMDPDHITDVICHPRTIIQNCDNTGAIRNVIENPELADFIHLHDIFFNGDMVSTPEKMFINALINTPLSKKDIYQISSILANASSENNYATPHLINKMNGKQNNFDKTQTSGSAKQWTPSMLYDLISQSVVGQDAAKKAAAILAYNHMKGHGRNIVMAGPTGCGKTEIWRSLAAVFPCIKIVNGPSITAEGYKGGYKFSSIFMAEDPSVAEHMILVIDEADKMMEPQSNGTTDWTLLLQNELLKIMDHSENSSVTFMSDKPQDGRALTINTEHISVVLCGSFERMLKMKSLSESNMGFSEKSISRRNYEACDCTEDDLVEYANMRVELAGRVNQIVTLSSITADTALEILNHPTASPIHKLEKQFSVDIIISDDMRQKLAEIASSSKFGCRMIQSRILKCLDDKMFTQPSESKYDLSNSLYEAIANDI